MSSFIRCLYTINLSIFKLMKTSLLRGNKCNSLCVTFEIFLYQIYDIYPDERPGDSFGK